MQNQTNHVSIILNALHLDHGRYLPLVAVKIIKKNSSKTLLEIRPFL